VSRKNHRKDADCLQRIFYMPLVPYPQPVNGMVSFKCKDFGMNCPWEGNAPNVADLKKKIVEHAKSVHNMKTVDAATWEKMEKVMKC
jgi:predicted small metal-binding protein